MLFLRFTVKCTVISRVLASQESLCSKANLRIHTLFTQGSNHCVLFHISGSFTLPIYSPWDIRVFMTICFDCEKKRRNLRSKKRNSITLTFFSELNSSCPGKRYMRTMPAFGSFNNSEVLHGKVDCWYNCLTWVRLFLCPKIKLYFLKDNLEIKIHVMLCIERCREIDKKTRTHNPQTDLWLDLI